MAKQNKIAMMTAAQFGDFTRTQKQSIVAWSGALLFAVSQCCNEKTNTAPMNELLRLPSVQFQNHKLRQFGNAVKSYISDLLGKSLQFDAEKGQFRFVRKSDTVYVDLATCKRFSEHFAEYGMKKASGESDPAPKKASASALIKAIENARDNGITAKDLKTAHALRDSIEALQTAALALVQSMESERDANAATVTDGSTGEHSKRQAHALADSKMTARAKTPRKTRSQTAMGRAMEKAADNAAKLAAAA